MTSRRSTRSTLPTLGNVKPLQISFSPSLRAALVRPLFAHLIDVCPSSLIPASLARVVQLAGQTRGVSIFLLRLYEVLSVCSPSTAVPGEDEAPNPAEGLDPKVVEVYTKYVPSFPRTRAKVSSHTIFSPRGCQSRPAPTQLPCRPTSKTIQNYPFSPRMGAHPRTHVTRAVVATSHACRDTDLHLEHEAAAGARVPRGSRPRSRSRGFGATFDSEGHAQAQSALV